MTAPPFKTAFAPIALLVIAGLLTAAPVFSEENSFTFTSAGDYGANTDTTAALKLLSRHEQAFHLALGDFSYDPVTPEEIWCRYVKATVGPDLPILLLSGNHESNGEDGLIDNFVSFLPDPIGVTGDYGKEYYFDYPKTKPLARFILISPGLNFTNGGLYLYEKGSERALWLAKIIDEARAAGIRWIIVGMHANCYTTVARPCETGPGVMNLLIEKKVDLILQANSHAYHRSKLLTHTDACPEILPESSNPECLAPSMEPNVYPKGRGSVLIINPSAGAHLYRVNPADREAVYFEKISGENVYPVKGFTRFTVSPDRLQGDLIVSRGGGISDSFIIQANAE